MEVAIAVAQTPVSWDIERNLAMMGTVIADARPGEIVVFPEAMVSGYDDDLSGLAQLDPDAIERGIGRLAELARGQSVHLFCGSLLPAGVWRSHLISHAAANQRFVIAANVADPAQHCPSMIVTPRGEILGELAAGETAVLRTVIDAGDVSDWYLGQRRTDVLRLHYQAGER